MSTLILRPNSDSTPLECTVSPSTPTTHYDKVDEETCDDADLLVVIGNSYTLSKTDIFSFPDHTSESGTINSVTIKCYCKILQVGTDTTAVYVNPSIKIGETVYNSGNQSLTTSLAEYSYTWDANPSGGSWGSDWAVIDALLAGVKLTSHNTSKSHYRSSFCYQLWVEVDYGAGGASVKPYYYYLNQ